MSVYNNDGAPVTLLHIYLVLCTVVVSSARYQEQQGHGHGVRSSSAFSAAAVLPVYWKGLRRLRISRLVSHLVHGTCTRTAGLTIL